MERLISNPFDDVTFTGGDPLYQAIGFTELAKAIRRNTTKTIWCYTGFHYENLLLNPQRRALLEQIDVLVDGPYLAEYRDIKLRFRGSRNQRLIDVPRSLHTGKVELWEE